eukprot:3740820-Pyramimonas_sp.AAC.1
MCCAVNAPGHTGADRAHPLHLPERADANPSFNSRAFPAAPARHRIHPVLHAPPVRPLRPPSARGPQNHPRAELLHSSPRRLAAA